MFVGERKRAPAQLPPPRSSQLVEGFEVAALQSQPINVYVMNLIQCLTAPLSPLIGVHPILMFRSAGYFHSKIETCSLSVYLCV